MQLPVLLMDGQYLRQATAGPQNLHNADNGIGAARDLPEAFHHRHCPRLAYLQQLSDMIREMRADHVRVFAGH